MAIVYKYMDSVVSDQQFTAIITRIATTTPFSVGCVGVKAKYTV